MTTKNISGHIYELSNGGSVFVGMSDEDGDTSRYVSLINAEKVETRFRLSKDAASALAALLVQSSNIADGWALVSSKSFDPDPMRWVIT